VRPDTNLLLVNYRGWLRKVATGLIGDHALVDDLAQEGWIAMWRATATYDPDRGALPDWLTDHAYWRMLTCVSNQAWLGRPRRNLGRGRLSDYVEHPTADDASIWELLTAADVLDGVALAYHRGQILEAINRLSPSQRRYVYLRFWRGYKHPDLVEAFGYDPQALWSSKINGAKGKLRLELEALAS
jgi:RNA polymerase sigma factor (sigma-70 family)